MLPEFLQSGFQSGLILLGNVNPQDACELSAQAAHPAFQPVAAVLGHQAGHGFDQARAVLANHCHYEGDMHGAHLPRRRISGKPPVKDRLSRSYPVVVARAVVLNHVIHVLVTTTTEID